MSGPMDVDQAPSALSDSEFNDRVLQGIEDYKKDHPDAFPSPTKLEMADDYSLFSIIAKAQNTSPDRVTYNSIYNSLPDAYARKSFAHLRNGVNIPSRTEGSSGAAFGSHTRTASGRSLQTAFEEPYQGDTHNLYVAILDGYRKNRINQTGLEGPYNWSISVIQSSGMGKSRMVEEAANLKFTIPINIRENLPEGIKTFPPPDEKFRNYFRQHQDKSDLLLQAEYAILLRVLFDKTKQLLEGICFHGKTGEALAVEWAAYLRDERSDKDVGKNRKDFLDSVAAESDKERKQLLEPSEGSLHTLNSTLKSTCKALVNRISPDHPRQTNAFFVYFDEAHQLTEPVSQPSQERYRTPYENLGKVLSELRKESVFFTFLSTNSHLQRFAPSIANHPSARTSQGYYLFPPFTELPFDTFMKDVRRQLTEGGKRLTLEKMCQTDAIVGFGRSLWYVQHKSSSQPGATSVLELAKDKLVARGIVERGTQSRLAALSIRVGLAFDQTTQASRMVESELVETHMRVVYAIPEHREFMHAGSPSEPVLAEVAARYLDDLDIAIQGPKILAAAFDKGLLARGERGELCGRLLMTIAHDIAVKENREKTKPELDPDEPWFHRPVPVLDFLRALFADGAYEQVLQAKSVTRKEGVCTLQEAFKESFVFFSHFALTEDAVMLSAPNLAIALCRGMALQAKDNQISIDAVIPIHMGSVDAPISAKTTSAINLQFKNRKKTEPCPVDRKITVPDLEMPVISIVFEFGVEKLPRKGPVSISDLEYPATSSNDTSTHPPGSNTHSPGTNTHSAGTNAHFDDRHYLIVAYGQGSGTFNAIPKEAEVHYKAILASGSIVQDFPRAQNKGCLQALHNLKPFFSGDRESLEWAGCFE